MVNMRHNVCWLYIVCQVLHTHFGFLFSLYNVKMPKLYLYRLLSLKYVDKVAIVYCFYLGVHSAHA